MDTFFKYIFIYQYCAYTYFHLIGQKQIYKSYRIFIIPFTILLSFLVYIFREDIPIISSIIPVTLLWIVLCFLTSSPKISYIATILSYGISHGIFAVSSSIILLIFTPIYYQTNNFPYNLFMVSAGVLGTFILSRLIKIKRFQNGMTFLYSAQIANLGVFTCLFSILILSYMHSDNNPSLKLAAILHLLLATSIILFIYWWQSQLNKLYRRKIQALELASLRNELQEKVLLIDKLQRENKELSRLIHKDNKLIPAMETAVYDYLRSNPSDQNNKLSQGSLILQELHNLSENRRDILSSFTSSTTERFSTGNVPLDALLNYMNKKAASLDENFTVDISPSALSQLFEIASVDDIVHLLADLIENAIISISDSSSRDIKLQIFQHGKYPFIELSDTGIPFQISTLTNLGLKATTTHAETGGSGIGLMDIWEIKNKYKTSLHIIEYECTSSFQKKISLLFDQKNQYLVFSWRADAIKPFVQRIDMHILANDVNTN